MKATLATVLMLAACSPAPAPPELTALVPSMVSSSVATRATLSGRNLGGAVELSLDDHRAAVLALAWRVRIGTVELPAGDVTLDSPEAISLVVPAGLPDGVYDLAGTSPRGVVVTLSQALTVVSTVTDCSQGSCGDGICCAATGETRCGCPADCGGSTCGDGCCSADELAAASCAQDCACSTSCGQGCGGNGCCGSTCAAGATCTTYCACQTCALDCQSASDCTFACEGARACSFTCDRSKRCGMSCSAGSTCRVSCQKSSDCAVDCNASRCEVDCKQGNGCNQTRCTNGAQCLLRCQASPSCGFAECVGGESSCPGKITVCNRACP